MLNKGIFPNKLTLSFEKYEACQDLSDLTLSGTLFREITIDLRTPQIRLVTNSMLKEIFSALLRYPLTRAINVCCISTKHEFVKVVLTKVK